MSTILNKRIAILGATSQIAKDLVMSLASAGERDLYLFARRGDDVDKWLSTVGLPGRYPVYGFPAFAEREYDAVINFVGAGDPAQLMAMGNSIFDITLQFDEMVLNYLLKHSACRYLFLSSGAAYGSKFDKPASIDTQATFSINELSRLEWYGAAKMHAECRHRSCTDLAIIDIRLFNYFSHTQDISARYLITDILRAIRNKEVLNTSQDYIVRDFLHPSDFHQLVSVLLSSPAENAVVDAYSRAPTNKPELLRAMKEKFGLRYEISPNTAGVNATGMKSHYYSINKRAADFGYQPGLTSLEGVLLEAGKILQTQA